MRCWILRILICLALGGIVAIGSAWGLSYYWFRKDKAATAPGGTTRLVMERHNVGATVTGVLSRFGSHCVMTTVYPTTPVIPDLEAAYDGSISTNQSDVPSWSKARQDAGNAPDQERAFGLPFKCMSYEIDVLSPVERRALQEEIRIRYQNERRRDGLSNDDLDAIRAAEREELAALRLRFATYFGGVEYGDTLQTGGPGSRYTYGALPTRPIWLGLVANTVICGGVFFLLFFGPGLSRQVIWRRRGACLTCGYLLRGDYAAGCPECGWNRKATETKRSRDTAMKH